MLYISKKLILMKSFFVKNRFAVLFVLFLLLGFITEISNISFENREPDLHTFTNKLFDKEHKVDELLDSLYINTKNNSLAKWVNDNSHTIDYLFKEKGIVFLVYHNKNLAYWTSNSIAVPDNTDWIKYNFTKLGNSYTEIRKKRDDTITIIGLISITDDYPYENKFLKNSFHPSFKIKCPHSIIIDSKSYNNSIFNKEGDYMFSLKKEKVCNSFFKRNLLIAIFSTALLFLLLFGRSKFKNIGFSIKQFILFSFVLIVIRTLSQVLSFPAFLSQLRVFQPKYFAFSDLFPSLGDLLITVVLIVYLIFVFYTKVKLNNLAGASPKRVKLTIITWLSVFILYAICAHKIFTHLIIDSSFQYEAYDVLNLSVFSFIGYFVLLLLFIGFILLYDKVIEQTKGSISFSKFIITIAIIALSIIAVNATLGNYEVILPVIFIFSATAYWAYIRFLYTPHFKTIVMLIAFFAAYATYFIRTENFKKRIAEGKVIAVNLAREQDPVAEIVIGDAINQMETDTVIKNYLEKEWFNYDEMVDYIQRKYFTGYLHQYFFNLTICNNTDSVLLDKDQQLWAYCYGFFNNLLKTDGVKTNIQGLYYLKDKSGGLNYFLSIEIPLSNEWSNVKLFFELSQKSNIEVLGYPELLLEKSVSLHDNYNSVSYAKYNNNILIISRGDFPYPLERNVYGFSNEEFAFFQSENYDHVLYNSHVGHTVIVSFPTIRFFNILISFTYIFFFLLIQTVLLLILASKFINIIDFQFSIKNKIVFSVILILLISLVFVGGGTIIYTYNRFEKGQIDILSEKIQSVLVELEHKLSGYGDIHNVPPDYVNNLLVKFSNVFYSDINLYDINGNLVGTSRKEIFERNLTGKKINAIAYRELVLNKKARVVHKEYIGSMEYYSAYVPFINADNELLAYLNLPYFSKEVLLRKELLRVVVGVINIYAFLLVLSIIVAVYISNKLTAPLRMVQQRIRNIDLSKKNERIDYKGRDEIAELVTEYNRMLDELDKSAKLLAKSERESAWREMARQIAHEIKNPLTPMKLSIQLLNKSWKNKDADFDKRFIRSTKTLIEQIDSLSSIAVAFSQFASMPVSRSEKVNIIERINQSALLFKECSFATLDMHLPKDKEVFVRADNERMLQVFNNLLKNAIQALPKDKMGKVDITLTKTNKSVVVEVRDNGVGIAPEMEDKLFQPNFTTKSSGTGLGLAIIKNIVEEFGGAIWYKSDLGKGTSFFVSMPIYKDIKS